MNKKLLSMILCVAMVLSLTVISVSASEDTVPTVVFSDDFSKDGAKSIRTETALSDKWMVGQGYGEGIPIFYSIYDGFLGVSYRWKKDAAKVYPTGDTITTLGIENEISYKMAHFGGYAGEERTSYKNDMWGGSSTMYSRFNVSQDGNSWFEIGKTGCTDTVKTFYLLPTSDENGNPVKDENGAVVNATTSDYTNRFYFRKVVNGETTYISWENDENGWFADKANYSNGSYRMWSQSAVFYNAADDPTYYFNTWFTVNIKNTSSGVEYSVTAKNLGNDNMYTWTGTYADTSLSRKGAGLYFGCKGLETGFALDDFSVTEEREVALDVVFEDDFAENGEKSIRTESALSDKWMIGQGYGEGIPIFYSIYDGFLGASYRWHKENAKVYPTSNAITYLPARNEISYKMAHFGGYPGEERAQYKNNMWGGSSTMYSRFNVSQDGNSWFEIGKTGCTDAIKTYYLLPTSDENGNPVKDENGAVVNATTSDYTNRFYFRKVVNGETTYIRWENDENGWFADKVNYSNGPYRMWAQSAVFYNGETDPTYFFNTWFTVNIKNTSSGIKYSVTAKNLGNDNMYTWTGTYADTSLSRKGAGLYFGCKGLETGFALDDVTVKAVLNAEMVDYNFTDNFSIYTSKNSAAYSESTKITAPAGKPAEIGRIAYHKLMLEGGSAYVDIANDALVVESAGGNAKVKYDFPKGVSNLESFGFKSSVTGGKGGVRTFKNKAGTAYVEYGTNVSDGKPYVTVVDGDTKLDFAPSWTSASNVYTWIAEADGDTIKITVTNDFGEIWGEKITYDGLSEMIAGTKYPFEVFADNAGVATVSYINSSLAVNDYEPTFFEDFSGYTTENTVAYDADTALTGIKVTPQLIAEKDDRKWILSGVHIGDYDGGHIGSSYLDIAGETMTVSDLYQKGTTTKLEIKDTNYDWISNIEFDASYSTGSRFGIQALVNSMEDEYYLFATGRTSDSKDVTDADGNPITDNIKYKTPYFQKYKYGKAVYTSSPDSQWNASDTHWNIDFEDGKIIWTATANGLTWSESYADPDLDRIMKNTCYPVSAFALGDGLSKMDNIAISYSESGMLCTDNGDGTVALEVYPHAYKRLMNGDYLSVVVAYYSENDKLVHAEIKKVTDMYNTAEFTVDKTVESSVRGKVFVFDGSILSNRQLGFNSDF